MQRKTGHVIASLMLATMAMLWHTGCNKSLGYDCGDDDCNGSAGESCGNCPRDCGNCTMAAVACGDGHCNPSSNESCLTCQADCGTCNQAYSGIYNGGQIGTVNPYCSGVMPYSSNICGGTGYSYPYGIPNPYVTNPYSGTYGNYGNYGIYGGYGAYRSPYSGVVSGGTIVCSGNFCWRR